MTEKQAYVVMLPLTGAAIDAAKEHQEQRILLDYFEKTLCAIGTPVDSSVPVAGYACPRDFEEGKNLAGASISFKPYHDWFPLVRQSDHLAALAEKQAETERLRISECKMKEAAVHLIRTMRRDDLTKTERIDAAIRQIKARLIPELAGAAS